jgi:flagellar motor switch protein FliM
VSTETVAAPAAPEPSEAGYRVYDFRRPTRLSREHVRILEMALDTLSRQWTTLLTTQLRSVCTVTFASVEQLTYDEYVSSLSTPTSLFVLELDPISGAGMLDVSVPVAMTVVDHLLGGPGREDQPERTFTEIEGMLLHSVFERALAELGYAFEGVLPLSAHIARTETSPQFAQAASPSDGFLVAGFELIVGSQSCLTTLALPFGDMFTALEKALQGTSSSRERADREAARRQVSARLAETPVEVSVVVGPTLVRMADVVNLQPGDVVRLGHPISEPLAVTSAGMTFAHAVPGSEGARMACLIVHSSEES